MVLISLALAIAALLALGAVGSAAPALSRAMPALTAGLSLIVVGLALATLAGGAAPVLLWLPVGLPGTGMTLTLDGLSAWFLVVVYLAGAAAALGAADLADGRIARLLPAFLGAMGLTLLAGDGFSLLLGFELMSVVSWGLILLGGHGDEGATAALLYIGMAALAGLSLLGVIALLAPLQGGVVDVGFATIRATPPGGMRAGIAVLVLMLGVGAKAGLVPLHVWLPPAHAAAPAPVSALMSGAMTKVALYVMIRVLFDLAGSAPPLWWGLVLVTLGVASAVLGALRATQEGDLKTILACSTIENIGLIATGLGVALAARAADVKPLASLALGAALLQVLAHGLFKPLLFLAAGAVQHGAGTRLLARLGGLIHGMKTTTACVLVGAAALAGLPPGPGFAGEWLLFQSLLGAPRLGGLATQTGFAMAAAATALAVALAAVAAMRLVGVAFLGRPRTPRGAAVEEAGPATRTAMLSLAGLALLLGLLPGPVLGLAEPVLRQLLAGTLTDRTGLAAVVAQTDGPAYSAPGIALLLAVLGAVAWLGVRRLAPTGHRRAPAWACGFAAPPPWLPFGDPMTQYGGASFAHILRRTLGPLLLGATETVHYPAPGDTGPATLVTSVRDPAVAGLFAPAARLRAALSAAADRAHFMPIRRFLAVMFAVLVLFLTAVALVEAR